MRSEQQHQGFCYLRQRGYVLSGVWLLCLSVSLSVSNSTKSNKKLG